MAKRRQDAGTEPTSCNGPAIGASLAPLRTHGKGEALERVSIRVPRGVAEWIAANPELAREILLRAPRGES